MKKIKIKTAKYTLNARLYGRFDMSIPCPVLIFFSGWNPGHFSWTPSDIYARLCSFRFKCVCITVGFRGMGSLGDINALSRADFLDDAMSVYDFMAEKEGVNKEKISVVGESFGSYISCLLSARRSIRNLVLRVPTDFPNEGFSDIPQIRLAGDLSREWKLTEHQFQESSALEAVHNFKGNIFLIASENDSFVPSQTIKNYMQAVSDSKKIEYLLMKNTGHSILNPIKMCKFIAILFRIIKKGDFH
jgi:uncharacterized protein